MDTGGDSRVSRLDSRQKSARYLVAARPPRSLGNSVERLADIRYDVVDMLYADG